MTEAAIQNAASQFGERIIAAEPFGTGLIHHSYKVTYTDSPPILLQCINQSTFNKPEYIIHNYTFVYNYLQQSDGFIQVPTLIPTSYGKTFYADEDGNFWRATAFISGSRSLDVTENEKEVFLAAKCFASFTHSLEGLDTKQLFVTLPHFHNLAHRYDQFEKEIKSAAIFRLLRSTHVISELRQRYYLVEFYNSLSDEKNYPTRVMHHDCKISNILFREHDNEIICPVDLDTVMPGKYFSDIGDMIRTMACTVDENSVAWEKIDINKSYYDAIIQGYLEGMDNTLTNQELNNIHKSGLIMIYMQCLRFVTDFLNNDIYYKTTYDEQNLNRALNQLILLEKLEEFLDK